MTAFRIVMATGTVLRLVPVFGPMVEHRTASLADCRLDEGASHPCEVLGADVGPTLYRLFVAGWLMMLTLPALGALLLAWGCAEVIAHFARRRRRLRRPDHAGPNGRGPRTLAPARSPRRGAAAQCAAAGVIRSATG